MDDSLECLVSKVEALHLAEDDVAIISAPGPISDEVAHRLRETWERALPGRKCIVMGDGLNVQTLGQHRQLQRIEQSLAGVADALQAVLQLLSDGEDPAEQRTLDGDLFSVRERDQSQPL